MLNHSYEVVRKYLLENLRTVWKKLKVKLNSNYFFTATIIDHKKGQRKEKKNKRIKRFYCFMYMTFFTILCEILKV